MDENRIIRAINLTLDPKSQKDAEKELEQMHKIIGFAPILLQLSTRSDIEFPVRHATAIYLKNLILNSWIKQTEKNYKSESWAVDNHFEIHEQDRAQVREMIVHSIVNSPLVLQSQLALCLSHIAQHDFPVRWPQVVERIQLYLTSTTDTSQLNGALLCLNKLVRLYEYRKASEMTPIIEALQLLLPIVYQIMCTLVNVVGSDDSYLLQKLVLKTIFSLIHYNMPLDLLNQAVFTQWMEMFLCVIKNPLPANATVVCDNFTADDLNQMLAWKCKKWAAAILERIFERYGQPNDVEKPFKQFANWYLKAFSYGILDTFLGILDTYRKGEFVGSRLMQKILYYITHAVSHSYCWNRLKPHMSLIIQEILFPILCYSKEDHELWTSDPIEYIHLKFESLQDLMTPVSAAEGLLLTMCRKRKNMLELIMNFVAQVMNENPKDSSRQDGALHFIGVLAPTLLKREFFTNQMDTFFETFVMPEFANPAPHLRARICWICHQFSELTFKQENMRMQLLQNITQLFLTDKELPVRIEASIAILMILNQHDAKCVEALRQYAQLITQEALKLITDTENEDVMSMLQKIFRLYMQELSPIAVQICDHLTNNFLDLVKDGVFNEEKSLVVMNLMSTLQLLLTSLEECDSGMVAVLEPQIHQIVHQTFLNQLNDFYEETLTLLYSITIKKVSDGSLSFLKQMYDSILEQDDIEYFVDMMPVIHNYVRVDPDKFLMHADYLLAVYKMCHKIIMSTEDNDDSKCTAAKLLEVIVLQFNGRIDHFLPTLVEFMFQRFFSGELKSSELRALCLQVIIAVLYCNPQLMMSIIAEKLPPNTIDEFVKQWVSDTDCFFGIHDRKLCILGLLTMIEMQPNRPQVLLEYSARLMPILIMLFDGLKTAYEQQERDSDSDTSSEISDSYTDSDDIIDSSDDETTSKRQHKHLKGHGLNSSGLTPNSSTLSADGTSEQNGLHALTPNSSAIGAANNTEDGDVDADDDDDDDDDDDSFYDTDFDEPVYESYSTPLDDPESNVDEYEIFQNVLNRLQHNEPEWYKMLIVNLSEDDTKALYQIYAYGVRRKAQEASRRQESMKKQAAAAAAAAAVGSATSNFALY